MSPIAWFACLVVGVVSGVINALAAGGSFLTLPLLIFLGLPATLANGTNRVGVLLQTVAGVWTFNRHDLIDWRWNAQAAVPSLAGAALGVWAALHTPEVALRRVLSTAIILLTLMALVGNTRRPREATAIRQPTHPLLAGALFVTGFYGGFLQAGVGFLLLSITTLSGLDLVRGNAVKALTVLLVTLLSLVAFAGAGHVHWPSGLALGVGNLAGGAIGARLAVAKGHQWLERAVAVAAITVAILLWIAD